METMCHTTRWRSTWWEERKSVREEEQNIKEKEKREKKEKEKKGKGRRGKEDLASSGSSVFEW